MLYYNIMKEVHRWRVEMKKLYKSEQSGRSMVEMLGVLAIIGVLSVGGIAGYSKAMAKYRTNQALDQIAMTIATIRTAFASARSYDGLITETARSWSLVPSEMYSTTDKKLMNPFQGDVEIGAVNAHGITKGGFYIQYKSMPRDACVAIATATWGESFLAVSNAAAGDAAPTAAAAAVTAVPDATGLVPFANGAALCTTTGNGNTIALYFY